jgi:uncharacterized membrane protein
MEPQMNKDTNDYPRWDTNEEWQKNYAPYIRWGMFYCNKNDKRLWVPKYKSKHGTTINMSHPYAPLVCVIIVLALAAILSIPFYLH